MTTLHFDTDAGRMTVSAIRQCKANITSEISNLRNRINSMVGAEWIAPSASQFHQEFEGWSKSITSYIATLEELEQRLQQEILEWETATQELR